MNLLKILIPAVVLKKLYGNKYSNSEPTSDDKNDQLQDMKDDKN